MCVSLLEFCQNTFHKKNSNTNYVFVKCSHAEDHKFYDQEYFYLQKTKSNEQPHFNIDINVNKSLMLTVAFDSGLCKNTH